MILSTVFFLFVFLPISLILYAVCPKAAKNILLIVVSLVFYAWGTPIYVVLLLLMLIFNYCIGRDLELRKAAGQTAIARILLTVSVLFNLVPLVFYKYAGFFASGLGKILPFELSVPELALPLGISFFTFQNLSYLFDVYAGRAPAQRNVLSFALYVSFFPKMLSGPIVPYHKMQPQLQEHPVTLDKISRAAVLLLIGLAKKVLIADNLAATVGSISAVGFHDLSGGTAWLGAICYSLQLYFDFSGYSDMAIGISMLFGFEFEKNFDYPYLSSSLTEFWRRWHISLGTWFRDYVYIPMGGSRVSTAKCIRNLLTVWLLTGLWHGASLTFVVWGLYHGLLLLLEKYPFKNVLMSTPKAVRHVLTLLCVVIGWVFFFSPDLQTAFGYLGRMLGTGKRAFWDSTARYHLATNWRLLLIAFAGCGPWVTDLYRRIFLPRRNLRIVFSVLLLSAVFLLCVAYMMNATYQSFLYAQF